MMRPSGIKHIHVACGELYLNRSPISPFIAIENVLEAGADKSVDI